MYQDLKHNVIIGFFQLFAHNGLVFVYVAGAIISLGVLVFKLKRIAAVYLIGFATLAIKFEYNKHIMEPLLKQTVETVVINPDTHLFIQRLINTFLIKGVPAIMWLIGWGSLFGATYFIFKQRHRPKGAP
ncbi:MAG: hypothetical protein NT141_03250 [candidate division WWE3 bacterium]|nr:hypothetical protein [candidate division WWE3 bacterium]